MLVPDSVIFQLALRGAIGKLQYTHAWEKHVEETITIQDAAAAARAIVDSIVIDCAASPTPPPTPPPGEDYNEEEEAAAQSFETEAEVFF